MLGYWHLQQASNTSRSLRLLSGWLVTELNRHWTPRIEPCTVLYKNILGWILALITIHLTNHIWLSLIQVLVVVDLIPKLSAVDHLQVRMPNCGLGEMNLRATYQRYQWLSVKVSNRHVRRLLMRRCSCTSLQREYLPLS